VRLCAFGWADHCVGEPQAEKETQQWRMLRSGLTVRTCSRGLQIEFVGTD
jgi:hypothetical protein